MSGCIQGLGGIPCELWHLCVEEGETSAVWLWLSAASRSTEAGGGEIGSAVDSMSLLH